MTESNLSSLDQGQSKRIIDTALRLGLVALLVLWSFAIFRPFAMPVLWAGIIAMAVYPLFLRFEGLLGGKRKLALTLFTLLGLALLIVPTVMLSTSTASTVQSLSTKLEEGTLQVPPPPASVAEWPLVGEKLHRLWSGASSNLEGTVKQYADEIKAGGKWFLNAAAGAGATVLQFVIAILIAAALIANEASIYRFFQRLAVRLAGDQGRDFADLARDTVRSVAQGVLGVAFIQALLAGIGMLAVGVPGAGLWSLLVLMLAIIQLPPILILGPIMVYVFSVADTTPAVLFMIWGILVSGSDAVLKPLFLGRGMDIPMLVILIGALGGMIMSGIIGLFVGAVVLALAYRLFLVWLTDGFEENEAGSDSETA